MLVVVSLCVCVASREIRFSSLGRRERERDKERECSVEHKGHFRTAHADDSSSFRCSFGESERRKRGIFLSPRRSKMAIQLVGQRSVTFSTSDSVSSKISRAHAHNRKCARQLQKHNLNFTSRINCSSSHTHKQTQSALARAFH